MARITQEQIEQINELYLVHKNKSLVARLVGVSVASVNKYLIPGYAGKDSVEVATDFDESKITGPAEYETWQSFLDGCRLTPEEWAMLKELQNEVLI